MRHSLKQDFVELLSDPPFYVGFNDVVEFERLDERLILVNNVCSDSIITDGVFLNFLPNNIIHQFDEFLSWLWIIRPDLHNEIYKIANHDLVNSINQYMGTAKRNEASFLGCYLLSVQE